MQLELVEVAPDKLITSHTPGIVTATRSTQLVEAPLQHVAYNVVPAGQTLPAGSYTKGEPVPNNVPPVGVFHQ